MAADQANEGAAGPGEPSPGDGRRVHGGENGVHPLRDIHLHQNNFPYLAGVIEDRVDDPAHPAPRIVVPGRGSKDCERSPGQLRRWS